MKRISKVEIDLLLIFQKIIVVSDYNNYLILRYSIMGIGKIKDIFDADVDDSDKVLADYSLMSRIYADIKTAAGEMDCDRLEEILADFLADLLSCTFVALIMLYYEKYFVHSQNQL